MKTTMLTVITILIAVTSTTATTYALDPNTATPKITFEKDAPVSWQLRPSRNSLIPIPADFPAPTHAVTIKIETYYLRQTRSGTPWPRSIQFNSVVDDVLKADVSEKLKLLIRKGYLGTLLYDHSFTYRFFAYSEEEAKTLTRAIVDACTKAASESIRNNTLQRDAYIKQIPEIKDSIASLVQEIKDVKTQIDKLTQSAYFTSVEQANQTVIKMNDQLNLLTIEVAGLQAKEQEMSTWRQQIKDTVKSLAQGADRQTWVDIRGHIEQTYIDLMIELRSAVARQQSMDKIRAQAWNYCQLTTKSSQLPKELNDKRMMLDRRKDSLRIAEEYIVNPGNHMKPPVIRGTVKIHEITGVRPRSG